MFRRWRVPAKDAAEAWTEYTADRFHSAVEKMIPYVKTLPYILPSISTTIMETKRTSRPPLTPAKLRITTAGIGDPRFMTEGIWQPVRLETWDALRIDNFHIHQHGITGRPANVTEELDIRCW